MPTPYENWKLKDLEKLHREYRDQLIYLASPSKLDTLICMGGMLTLFAGAGSVLSSGLNIINCVLLVLGGLGSYKWHQMDQLHVLLNKELKMIEEAIVRK